MFGPLWPTKLYFWATRKFSEPVKQLPKHPEICPISGGGKPRAQIFMTPPLRRDIYVYISPRSFVCLVVLSWSMHSSSKACCCCCCFSHSAHWLPTRKKLLYTMANPARGLLNREKNKGNGHKWVYPPLFQTNLLGLLCVLSSCRGRCTAVAKHV